jgi:hypothetical protein
MRRTKSRDLSFYKHFFKYDDPNKIDTKVLAKQLRVSQQKIAGHIRAAKNNQTITEALIQQGDTPPLWFANAGSLLQRYSVAQAPVTAVKTTENHISSTSVNAGSTPERSATLSGPSAQPRYIIVQAEPKVRSPTHSRLAEFNRRTTETLAENSRRILEDTIAAIEQGRASPRAITFEELEFKAEMSKIRNDIEARNFQTMINFMILNNPIKEPIDTEEFAKQISESFEKIQKYKKEKRREEHELVKALPFITDTLMPHAHNIDTNQVNKYLRNIEKEDRKAFIEIAKTIAEYTQPRKNLHLEMLENEGEKIMKNFRFPLITLPIPLRTQQQEKTSSQRKKKVPTYKIISYL